MGSLFCQFFPIIFAVSEIIPIFASVRGEIRTIESICLFKERP